MSQPCLLIRRDKQVAEMTLNRPEAMNALSRALTDELSEAFRTLSADTDLRAIIVTGAGRAFCGGLDLKELSQNIGAIGDSRWNGAQSLISVVRACPHPVISAVNGFAITGGLELALMGDFLIASDKAQFADTHARVGITPSWGLTQVLPRLIGINRARQMSLTGEFVDARTACDWGLVNEVVPAEQLMKRARALATQIAETDRATLGKIRSLIGQSAELPLSEGLAREVAVFDAHIAGVTAEKVTAGRAAVTARGRRIAGKTEGEDTT